MLSERGTRVRTLLFLILLSLWVGWRFVEALPRILWDQPAASIAQLPQAMAPEPATLLIPLALSPEMVALIEAELPLDAALYLYRRTDRELLDRQVLRCSQYFFPRPVRGIHSESQAVEILAEQEPRFVVDYSAETKSPFAADYEIVAEHSFFRLWRRKAGS